MQASLVALLCRANDASIEAVSAVAHNVSASSLGSLISCPFLAPTGGLPGQGVSNGARVVVVNDGEGLIRGVVYVVISVKSDGTCTLRRLWDGKDMSYLRVSITDLALAGDAVEGTAIHLSFLCCKQSVAQHLFSLCPGCSKDALGRSPLEFACWVRDQRILT